MPELPEVETVRRILSPLLAGRRVEAVDIRSSQVIAHPASAAFAEHLTGQTIEALSRRGKFLTLHLHSGDRVVLHLRMTGQLLVLPADTPEEKHTHLVLDLPCGQQLRYIDVRRFGRFWLLGAQEEDDFTGQAALGLEPDAPALTSAYLQARLGKRGKTIKEMLLDQTVVAGIGNIYSDEILFAAGVHPLEKCTALDAADWERLAVQIPAIISWAIEKNGMTAEDYLRGRGREYRSMPYLRVYGREGRPCPRCGHPLERAVVGGRSTCCCPVCQGRKPC